MDILQADKIRMFDCLKKPNVELDCVIHVCTHWGGITARNQPRVNKEFRCLKNQIKRFTDMIPSSDAFSAHMVISVNGFFPKDNEELYKRNIEYLQSINNTNIGNNIFVIVFQRPNFGWQWGAFYDVWTKYKDIKCDFFLTLESDVYLNNDKWYDYLKKRSINNGNGFVGQIPIHDIDPEKFNEYSNLKIWRDENDKPFNVNKKQTEHTRGGVYFCKRELLQKMDDVYGCFTHSMGVDLQINGILMGEVGFSQKTTSLGYQLLTIDDNGFFIVDDELPMEL